MTAAHLAVGDGAAVWSWSVGTGVLCGVSYFFYRRLQASAAAIRSPSGILVRAALPIRAAAALNMSDS